MSEKIVIKVAFGFITVVTWNKSSIRLCRKLPPVFLNRANNVKVSTTKVWHVSNTTLPTLSHAFINPEATLMRHFFLTQQKRIVIYSKSEEGKAFVHVNCSASWTMQFKWAKAAVFGFVRYLVREWVCKHCIQNFK
jgi:hypothetical protein